MTGPPSIPALRARVEYLAAEVKRLNNLWRRSELGLPIDPKECRPLRQLAYDQPRTPICNPDLRQR